MRMHLDKAVGLSPPVAGRAGVRAGIITAVGIIVIRVP